MHKRWAFPALMFFNGLLFLAILLSSRGEALATDSEGKSPTNINQALVKQANTGKYEKDFVLPGCLATNAKIIKQDDDWDDINSPQYNVFCVEANVYTGDVIKLNAAGTVNSPRIIRYYNPLSPNEKVHPVHLDRDHRAVVNRRFKGAGKFWVIHGLAFEHIGKKSKASSVISLKGGNNTFDYLLIDGNGGGAGQVQLKDYDVIQNSVLRRSKRTRGDSHCIVVGRNKVNSRIVNNEIYDCAADGIQIHPGVSEGTIVYNNDIYFTKGFRYAENAFDTKSSGTKDNPIIVENNRMSGISSGVGGTSTPGPLIQTSNKSNPKQYALYKNNILFNSAFGGINISGGTDGVSIGTSDLRNISVVGNVLFNVSTSGTKPAMNSYNNQLEWLGVNAIFNNEYYYNLIINPDGHVTKRRDYWFFTNGRKTDIKCNMIFNGNGAKVIKVKSGLNFDQNAFYNTPTRIANYRQNGIDNLIELTSANSANTELCFNTKPWTGKSDKKNIMCIQYGKFDRASLPESCKNGIGELTGYGINDTLWTTEDAQLTDFNHQ